MRIIAGALGGRIFKTAEGPGYRPATARVRSALFSMLASRGIIWPGLRVLDLFAGSGSLSFEALSRGADYACLVEKEAAAANCLRESIEKLGFNDRCQVVEEDVGRFIRRQCYQPFDIIFVDPPYEQNRLIPALKAVMRGGWLVADGYLLAEAEEKLHIDAASIHTRLKLETDRTYGQTRILLWHIPPSGL